MPVHAVRMLPGSERITSDVRGLVEGFDPARPLAYELEFDCMPPLEWARPWRDVAVDVREAGEGRGCCFGGLGGERGRDGDSGQETLTHTHSLSLSRSLCYSLSHVHAHTTRPGLQAAWPPTRRPWRT